MPKSNGSRSSLPHPDWTDDELGTTLAADLLARRRAGDPARVESYLEVYPWLAGRDAVVLALMAAEVAARGEGGETADGGEYRARFPALAARLPAELARRAALPETPAPHGPTPSPAPSYPPTPGLPELPRRLGPYRVVRKLGRGGMGVVYHAVEDALARAVAVKVMRPELAAEPASRARFLREARAMAAVEHPHVVAVYRVDEDDGVPYVAMPLLKGRSLADRLKEGPLPAHEVARLGREMAEGLAAAHAAGLVHRDIKPDNVWLRADGTPGEGSAVVLDFGLARSEGGGTLTRTGAVVGTPHYMSPEQASGTGVDNRADLFSLGCVLYEMATGERPFDGPNPMGVLFQIANHTPPSLSAVRPGVPPGLARLVSQLMEKDRARRPATAGEVAEALRRLEKPPVAARPRRRWAALLAVSVGGGLAAAGVLTWLTRVNRDNSGAVAAVTPAEGPKGSVVAPPKEEPKPLPPAEKKSDPPPAKKPEPPAKPAPPPVKPTPPPQPKPPTAEDLTASGLAALERNNLKDAIAFFTSAIRADAKQIAAFRGRAEAHRKSKELVAAAADADEVVRLTGRSAEALAFRGAVLLDLLRTDEALAAAEEARERNPAVQLAPAFGAAFAARGRQALAKSDFVPAIKDFTTAVELGADSAAVYADRGRAYLGAKKSSEAADDFTQAVSLDPGNAEAHYELGRLWAGAGLTSEALASFSKAVRSAPKMEKAYRERGLLLLKQGDDALALADLGEAIRLGTKSAAVFIGRAGILTRQKRFKDAIDDYTAALDLDRKNLSALLGRANAYMKDGQRSKYLSDTAAYRGLMSEAQEGKPRPKK